MSRVDPSSTSRISVAPPTISSPVSLGAQAPILAAIGEDGFVSEATVDGWVRSGAGVRSGALLSLRDGRELHLRDAIRVLGRRNGDTDPYGFTGRVDAIRDLLRRGANISADALRLGPAIYDIEYGYLVTVSGSA